MPGDKYKGNMTDEHRRNAREKCRSLLFSRKIDEGINAVARYQDPEDLPHEEQEELKYHLLARITKGLQSNALNILRAQTYDGRKRTETVERQSFRFVFLMDNSGSMFGEKMTLSLTLLTILLETFKRMEFDSAVVRFGGDRTQVTLKSFDNEMNCERGQLIVEAFDSSEKTLPADAVRFVAETKSLFQCPRKENEHRFIVLITDGIWNQVDRGVYARYFSKAGAWPLILTTNPRKSEDLQFYNMSVRRATEILNKIAPESWYGLDHERDLSVQVCDIANIICRKVFDCLENEKKQVDYKFCDLKVPEISQSLSKQPTQLQHKNAGQIEWGSSVSVSDICTMDEYEPPNEDFISAFMSVFHQQIEKIRSEVENPDSSPNAELYAKIVNEHEASLSEQISDINDVLDTVVFPNNRPTRVVQDYHGPTFSLRGFIRFICTDGQYKKIYENVIGHPRKDYRISLILDTSTSMGGMTAVGSIDTFIALAASLHNVGVDFCLMTCATNSNIVKGFDQAWDDVAKARAFSTIKFKEQNSNIADSILYAAQLQQQGVSSRTVKMIFVISDGYDSSPGRLRSCLGFAESQGIVVVGIGIGYFTDAVRVLFPRSIIANKPSLLSMGLKKLFSGEADKFKTIEMDRKEFVEEEKSVQHNGQTLTTVEEIWDLEMKEVYKQQVERTKNAIYFTTKAMFSSCNFLSIDMCFVLDTTGSMTSVIEMAKEYSLGMMDDIKRIVSNFGRVAALRVGFVTYKFFTNRDHKKHIGLTDDITRVQDFINSISAGGGGGSEDKSGGLRMAVDMRWQGSAKFIVLMGDCEDHMTACAGCHYCRPYRHLGDVTDLARQIASKGIYLFYVRINRSTDREENAMMDAYMKAATPSLRENGFMSLDISDGGNLKLKMNEGVGDVIVLDFM